MDFETIEEQINKLLEEDQPNWKQLEAKFSYLSRFIGTNSQYRAGYNALKERYDDKRQSLFDLEYEQLQDEMSALTNSEFDQRVRNLIELGGANNALDIRINDLKARRRNAKNINDFVARARKNLQLFESQIANDMDKLEALNAFLLPIKVEGERLLQEGGDNPTLTAILAELRQAEKLVNAQVAFSTMAALGEFERVIASIEAKPDNEEIELIGVGGINAGRRKKIDALDWYQERAREFEEKKVDEYLTKARQELNDGRPVGAKGILAAVDDLKRISGKKRDEVRDFVAQNIAPIMKRVNDARFNLEAVSRASSLKESIRLFDLALDVNTGWPEFDTVAEHKRRADQFLGKEETSQAEDGLVGRALKYIYDVMEREFQEWQAQEADFASGHRLYYRANQQQIADLQFFIHWRDKRLSPVYGGFIARLVEKYNEQAKQVHDLNDAVIRALSTFNQGNYTMTYDLLLPYAELLEVEKAKYIDGYNLWIKVQEFVPAETLRQELKAILAQGIVNPNLLESELSRLEVARDKGMSIAPDKAMATGLTRTIKDVASLYNLVRGVYERQQGHLASARDYIEQAIQGFSHEYPDYVTYAKEILVELKANIKEDSELNAALDAAQIELDAGQIRIAYNLLLPHQDKTTSTRYPEYQAQMSRIRPQLSEELRQKILQLLQQDPQEALELEDLANLLEQVDSVVYASLKDPVKQVLDIQQAYKLSNIAQTKQDPQLWRRAVEAWEKVDDESYSYQYYQALESYMAVYIGEELNKAPQSSPDKLDEARQRLYDVLKAVEKLVIAGHNQQVPLLNLRIYATLITLEETLYGLSNTLQRAEHESSQCSSDDRETTEYENAQRQIQRGRLLYKTGTMLVTTFTPEYPLAAWHTASVEWTNALTAPDETIFIGLRVWEKKFFEQTLTNLQATLESTPVIWQQIEPASKISLITGNINPTQLDGFYANLHGILRDALNNYRGNYVPEGFEETAYLSALERALQCLHDILEIMGIPPRATYTLDDIYDQILAIKSKREETQYVYDALQRAREKLGAACANGYFDAVTHQLLFITQSDGTHNIYHEHLAIITFNKEVENAKQERQRLLNLAANATIQAQREELEQALTSIRGLQKADRRFMAIQMVRYVDPVGTDEVIENADDMCDIVEDKYQIVEALLNWLSPIIGADVILKMIRPDPDQLPITPEGVGFMGTNIVNFEMLEIQKIESARAYKQYDVARRELTRLALGDIKQETDPATYYDSQYLSLAQARDILKNCPIQKTQLNSATAAALYNWGVMLYNFLREYLGYCDGLDNILILSEQRFDEEYDRFRLAYRELQQGTRDRKRYLEILHEAYKHIRGDASGILPTTGREQDLYPLAHLWTGLDDDYKNYKNAR